MQTIAQAQCLTCKRPVSTPSEYDSAVDRGRVHLRLHPDHRVAVENYRSGQFIKRIEA